MKLLICLGCLISVGLGQYDPYGDYGGTTLLVPPRGLFRNFAFFNGLYGPTQPRRPALLGRRSLNRYEYIENQPQRLILNVLIPNWYHFHLIIHIMLTKTTSLLVNYSKRTNSVGKRLFPIDGNLLS